MAVNKGVHPDEWCVAVISEFIVRKRLAKLGIISTIDEISAEKADAFLLIEDELDEIEARRSRAKNSKGRR